MLALDDTLARQRGRKMFGTGRHHDLLLSSRSMVVTNWGHGHRPEVGRVVPGVFVELPFRLGQVDGLPIFLSRLYLNPKSVAKHRRASRTRPELAVELLELLYQHRNSRRFHVVADSADGGQSVRCHLPTNGDLTRRLRQDARLYAAAPARKPGTKGRPRKRGERRPTPHALLAGRCRRVTLDISGRREQARVADQIGHVPAPPTRPLRVVAVEALKGGRGQEAFDSTCAHATAEQVIGWYARRGSIEVTHHDSQPHLGFKEPPGWSRRSVERTAPLARRLYSLIVWWFAQVRRPLGNTARRSRNPSRLHRSA